MRALPKLLHAVVAAAAVLIAAGAAGIPGGDADRPIVVGSKSFTENRLLAEIMAQLIEGNTPLTVERRLGLGGTIMVFSALRSGQIDMYPEYTGTGWAIHLRRTDRVNDPLRAWIVVSREFHERWHIRWLPPFGFSNSYALAMPEKLADKLGIVTISDLKKHESEIRAGVSHEFLNREDGYPGLAAAYGLDIPDLRGMEHGLAYEAIATGETDLIDTWTTDGKLLRYPVRVLADNLHFFPPYDAAPIVREETLSRHPELGPLLSKLGFTIDDDAMRHLNYRVEEEGATFAAVARDFLVDKGLVGASRAAKPALSSRPEAFIPFMLSRTRVTLGLTAEHLYLTGTAVLLAILFSVPVGIVLTRNERLSGVILGGAGVVQTVPSLALLAFMIPVPGLGLGARSAIAALFLYALLPILRNTVTGIRGVDADLIEAGRGMGLTENQLLLRIQLPLAVRTIMAGIRTSTIISIGVATLAAFIGAGGLGEPIITGLQLNDIHLILSGAIPAALLAVLVDLLLGALERLLTPRGLAPRAA